MSSRKPLVLVVDDDVRMLRMMRRILELENYRIATAENAEAALDAFDRETPDLVLLDVMMPGMDGYTACQRIREFSQIPIIMVTARSIDEEKVRGLDAGADDYITKPFSASELTARVRALLRRATLRDEIPEPVLKCGDLVIDFGRQRVTLDGQYLNLTATEHRLLSYLARNTDRILTPNQILEKVWGEKYIGETNLLQANITRLRKRLKDSAKNPKYILTRPGIGYMMVKKPEP
ncbi:MAG: response regulator transcription factor [Dehalococcoidales bacterium]|nr:response regulator transcription factor [Dehalococcoidales bacterium]